MTDRLAADEQSSPPSERSSQVIFLPPGGGREYQAGPMYALFKADGAETDDRYCVSEWWLESGDPGPGPHSHQNNEEIFYVIAGTMSFLAGERWLDAPRGSFLRVPAGVTHDFENRGAERAGVLNVFLPGGFEARMPEIIDYFAKQATAPAATGNGPNGETRMS